MYIKTLIRSKIIQDSNELNSILNKVKECGILHVKHTVEQYGDASYKLTVIADFLVDSDGQSITL